MFIQTLHAEKRMVQRNLSLNDVEYVIQNGLEMNKAGAIFCILRKSDIVEDGVISNNLIRLVGTAVVLSKDGIVITAWRNRRYGLKKIKMKPKYYIPRNFKSRYK